MPEFCLADDCEALFGWELLDWELLDWELPVGELPVGELPVEELSVGELPVEELSVEELSVGDSFDCGISPALESSLVEGFPPFVGVSDEAELLLGDWFAAREFSTLEFSVLDFSAV